VRLGLGCQSPRRTERPLQKIDAKDHVEHGARRIDIEFTHDARLQTRYAVSKRAQGAAKEHVLLEAIPASSADDHLVLKAEVQLRMSIQKDIDALVGDGGRMSVDNRPERLKSRRTGATVAMRASQPS
jgi:hypothetical protein